MAGVMLDYEIELVLRGPEVRSTILGPAPSGRLGWDAYLAGPQADDRTDVRYDVHPL
jgi:type VI secretion system protein ImpH